MNPRTSTTIDTAHCTLCLSRRACQSLPHSNNCERLRRTSPALAAARDELININRRLERELSEEEAT